MRRWRLQARHYNQVLCSLGEIQKLLLVLTSKHTLLRTCGKLFSACVQSALLHSSETLAPSVLVMRWLCDNDRLMIHWICCTKPQYETPSSELLTIEDITSVLHTCHLRWFGHIQRALLCIRTVSEFRDQGHRGRGRPRKM